MVRLADLPPSDRENMLKKVPTLPRFEQRPWVRGPKLAQRRVAIVSTAGLHARGDRPFGSGGMDYRVIPGDIDAGDLIMSHMSVNFDRTGFQEDWNVAFPLDRLKELARERVIGSVAAFHYSFMGAVSPVTNYESKAGELAQLLKNDNVDAVLLSPVWPNCTCAVGALGHYLEAAGIHTTQISLVREHTEALAPPRALWVPFMLGRPFGVPNDAAFQQKVLLAALQLFERETGPVLDDFPHDAPHQKLTSPPETLVCPVSFPRMQTEGTLQEKLADEVSQLQAWHELAVKHRGRTTLGVTGMQPPQIVEYLSAWLDNQPPQSFRKDISPGDALKQACDELKAFYLEAKSVQPGQHSAASIQEWFWMETALAQAIVQIRAIAANSTEPSAKTVAVMSLIPRAMEAMLKRTTNANPA